MIDVSTLTNDELAQLSEQIPLEVAARLDGLSALIKIQDNLFKPVSGRKRVQKAYRNPDNTAETWNGVGKRPDWFKAALERGVDRDSMVIPAETAEPAQLAMV